MKEIEISAHTVEEAIEQARRTLELDPDFATAHRILIAVDKLSQAVDYKGGIAHQARLHG